MIKVKRPLLRYFGGKWKMKDWILSHFPPHDYYAEPFAGAASILLAKNPAPRGEMLNDLNSDLINLFQVLRDEKKSEKLIEQLNLTLYSYSEYLAARGSSSTDPVEKARVYVVKSFMGIGTTGQLKKESKSFRMGNVGLSRTGIDSRGTFRNCGKEWMDWKGNLSNIIARLQHVSVHSKDALEFIPLCSHPKCLLYVDPPYHHENRSNHRYLQEFDNHSGLVDALLEVDAMVILSGYECEEYKPLEFNGWKKIQKKNHANFSKNVKMECLWISPNAIVQEELL